MIGNAIFKLFVGGMAGDPESLLKLQKLFSSILFRRLLYHHLFLFISKSGQKICLGLIRLHYGAILSIFPLVS